MFVQTRSECQDVLQEGHRSRQQSNHICWKRFCRKEWEVRSNASTQTDCELRMAASYLLKLIHEIAVMVYRANENVWAFPGSFPEILWSAVSPSFY